jgi:Family of unknown function (DUF6232)
MATSNPLGSNQSITLERNQVITITQRTVRFSNTVYQTHNITSFSEGAVDIGTIPWSIIVSVFFASLIAGIGNSALGGLLVLVAIGGVVWNLKKPKYHGLLITLNSGDKTLFVTDELAKLKQIVLGIYDFIEKEKNNVFYEICINNSEVKGNLINGNVGGNTSYLSGN